MSQHALVWPEGFREVYDRAVKSYEGGAQSVDRLFTPSEVAFLSSIGCSAQELFDFVEDYCRGGEPSYESVLLVTAVRREFFLKVQGGKPSGQVASSAALPAKQAAVAGIPWLPRIIEKARIKLRGEMPPELMYGCGGDRPFLKSVGFELADFLRLVWDAGDNTAQIVSRVVERSKEQRR